MRLVRVDRRFGGRGRLNEHCVVRKADTGDAQKLCCQLCQPPITDNSADGRIPAPGVHNACKRGLIRIPGKRIASDSPYAFCHRADPRLQRLDSLNREDGSQHYESVLGEAGKCPVLWDASPFLQGDGQ